MILNEIGEMSAGFWDAIPATFPGVSLDARSSCRIICMVWSFIEPRPDNVLGLALGDIMKWFKGTTGHHHTRGVRERGWPPYDRQFGNGTTTTTS